MALLLVKQLSQNPQLKKRITVIDGHSHTVLQNGQIYNNDALAQTGTALAILVRLHLIIAMERYRTLNRH